MNSTPNCPDERKAGSFHAIVAAPLAMIVLTYILGAVSLLHAPVWGVATAYILFSALLVGGVAGERQAYNTVKEIAENSLDAYWRRQFASIPLARVSWPLSCIVMMFVAHGWTFAHFCRRLSMGSPQAFRGANGEAISTDTGSVLLWMNYAIDRFLEVVSLGGTGIYGISVSGISHNPVSLPACHLVFAQSAVLSLTLVTLLVNAVVFGMEWFRSRRQDPRPSEQHSAPH